MIVLLGAASTAGARGGDPGLIQIVGDEFETVSEFLNALVQLESALLERNDARAVFAATYRVLTTHANGDLETGQFEDTQWATALSSARGLRRHSRDAKRWNARDRDGNFPNGYHVRRVQCKLRDAELCRH